MRIKATPALALLSLTLLGPLAACGDDGGGSTDIQPTLRFADLSDLEIARLVSAAGGTDMFQALSQVDRFGDVDEFEPDPDPCPAVAVSGTTATLTGGCTTRDGVTIAGAAVVTNPRNWDLIDVDFGVDSTYELQALSFSQSGFTQRYDGVIDLGGDYRTWDADLTTDSNDVRLRTDLYVSCTGGATEATCTTRNSGLALDAGGATLSGTQRLRDQTVTTDLTLRGVDTLTIHVEDNCVSWQISGSDRRSTACP